MIAFVHIQKTAGTTLTSILRRSLGLRHFDTRGIRNKGCVSGEELRRVCGVYWKLESIAGHSVRPLSDLNRFFPSIRYYTFLREPLARTISHFAFHVRRGVLECSGRSDPRPMIRDFLQRVRNTQTNHLVGRPCADEAIDLVRERIGFVGLVERFDESLVLFRRWAAHPTLDISYVAQNVSARDRVAGQNLLRDLMHEDPEVAEWVADSNREDDRLYNWVRDEWYPAQCAAYGPELASDVNEFLTANARSRLWLNDSLIAKAYRHAVFQPYRILTGLGRTA